MNHLNKTTIISKRPTMSLVSISGRGYKSRLFISMVSTIMVACQSSSAFHQFAFHPSIIHDRCSSHMHVRQMIVADRQHCFRTTTSRCNTSTEIQSFSSSSNVEFLGEVTSFLDEDDIPWRYLS